jgi:hypothetical protein
MRNLALLLLASCASAPVASPEPLPLEEADTSPSVGLFIQKPEDAARFHEFAASVQAHRPAEFRLERTARDGTPVVEEVRYDGSRHDYTDGTRRLVCLYLSGARLSGCKEAEPQQGEQKDPLDSL